jgi:drug/metabolite transporter (DMT)-like permease
MPPSSDRIFRRAAPALFVFLWSTGWIVARYSAEYADPLTFLSARYACAGAARSFGFVDAPVEHANSHAGVARRRLFLGVGDFLYCCTGDDRRDCKCCMRRV